MRSAAHRTPRAAVDQVDAGEPEHDLAVDDDALGEDVVDDVEQRGVGPLEQCFGLAGTRTHGASVTKL